MRSATALNRRRLESRSLALVLLTACAASGAPEERFALELDAVTSTGEAVPEARFWADGRELGSTGPAGTLRTELLGSPGREVALTAACPPAFHTSSPRRMLLLRHRICK